MTYETLINSLEGELRSLNSTELTMSRMQYWLAQFVQTARSEAYAAGYEDAANLQRLCQQRSPEEKFVLVEGDFTPGELCFHAEFLVQ